MAGIARPFIPWIGSKEKLIPYIWQVFPLNPKLYLEPFGGGGALLLGIQPKISRMDIYNDFNCDLVNLFLCARECTMTNVLTAFSCQRTFVIFYLLNSDITGGVVHNYAFSCIHRYIGCR